jgi:hypothetical protein
MFYENNVGKIKDLTYLEAFCGTGITKSPIIFVEPEP